MTASRALRSLADRASLSYGQVRSIGSKLAYARSDGGLLIVRRLREGWVLYEGLSLLPAKLAAIIVRDQRD